MHTVYVVAAGERGEGHSPHAACTTLDAAKALVNIMAPGVQLVRTSSRRWRAVMPNGVDELWICSMPLRGGEPR